MHTTAEWKEYIQNYKIHVLDICHTPDERLLEFPDKIACMFLAIKHAGNKQRFSELINMFPFFHNLDEDTYDTIWNYVGNPKMLEIKKELETKKGGIDMRCAIDEIYEDGIAEGEQRGEQRGMQQGMQLGEARGIASMLELLKELGCSANDVKLHLENKLHMSEEKANEYIRQYWN